MMSLLLKKCQILVLFDQEGCIGVTANNTSIINSALYLKQCMATIRFLKTFYHNPSICICDCHCDGQTLPRLSGLFTDIVFTSMPWNIDFSTAYSFALLIGFHGMQGTNDPLAHTFRPEIKQLKINNKVEITLNF